MENENIVENVNEFDSSNLLTGDFFSISKNTIGWVARFVLYMGVSGVGSVFLASTLTDISRLDGTIMLLVLSIVASFLSISLTSSDNERLSSMSKNTSTQNKNSLPVVKSWNLNFAVLQFAAFFLLIHCVARMLNFNVLHKWVPAKLDVTALLLLASILLIASLTCRILLYVRIRNGGQNEPTFENSDIVTPRDFRLSDRDIERLFKSAELRSNGNKHS